MISFSSPTARILDLHHYSITFGEERNFRIFLPPDYEAQPQKRYPVIYWFHGYGERFNKSPSDEGYNGDNIAAFVGAHDVIVVRWDGYNPRKPGESYPRPYNVYPVETYRQFPLYFPELVSYIDAHFRTTPDRAHRATAGLSMGGFMSFWVAGKYPQLVGSASNFMGSSEFFAGPNGFPSEYRHDEMYSNYKGLYTRIVLGSRDFIRWYHRRMNAVWDYTRPHHEHEEFDSEHGTPGIAKTFAFHLNAFAHPLPEPALWNHIDLYPVFDVWGYAVASDRSRPGFTVLENVSRAGFRSSVREWLPGGRLMPEITLQVATSAAYRPETIYSVTVVNLDTGDVMHTRQRSDANGRLHFSLSGARHEVGISENGRPVLAVAGWRVAGAPWAVAGRPVHVALSVLNKGERTAQGLTVRIGSPNPQVEIRERSLKLDGLAAGRSSEVETSFVVRDPRREVVQLKVSLADAAGDPAEVPLEVPLLADAPPLETFRVVDGAALPLFERAVERSEKALGAGNGDGVVNPGETIAIALPDGDAYRAAELFSNDECVDLTERRSDPWAAYDHVGATAKISLALVSSACPEGHEIPLFARVQFPNKPEHALKQGLVRLRVTGRDRTAPRVVWAQVRDWNRIELRIADGGRVRHAVARLRNGDVLLEVPLHDEGLFTGLVPNPPPGRYTLTVVAEDQWGNRAESVVPGDFEFRLPPPAPALAR